jgi:hypothetical protein
MDPVRLLWKCRKRAQAVWLLLCLIAAINLTASAQDSAPFNQDVSPAPFLTGGIGYITHVEGGHPINGPVASPVFLLPIGQKWLLEGRGDFEGDIETRPEGGVSATSQNLLDYLQLDYIANKYVTVTVGRFLTPFGIYNERLYPIWIRALQSEPLILPVGTGVGSNDGAMLRGGFDLSHTVELNYAAYFSALSTVPRLDSERLAGARLGLFFPKHRFEIGASGQHVLDGDRANAYGLHMAWQPLAAPLSLHAEYAYDARGKGYWLEAAYRLSKVPAMRKITNHTEVVARVQQFSVGKDISENEALGLPVVQTNQFDFGVNYYFRDDFRIQAAYGRSFSAEGNQNQWTIGITYRFVFPLLPGVAQ